MNNLQKLLNSVEDSETWFYGARDRNEQTKNTNQIISNKVQKQKPKRSLFEDSLGCFMVYKRQDDALLKCKQEGPMARVFAFEYSIYYPGQRQYLVSTVQRFWQWYKKQCDVSFYELIPQNRPARLYFDLEFYWKTNPNINEKDLIKDFNDCVIEVFMEMFGVDLDPEKQMLVLDASTTTKFSEHIIVHLFDNHLFPSNTSMKFFIQQLKEKMLSSGRCLVWNVDATKLTTLFDTAVYSVNRNFRLYLSSKLGKNNPLVLAKRCNFYVQKKYPSKQQIFLDSLIVPAKYSTSEFFYIPITENREYLNIQKPKTLIVPTQVPSSSESLDYMIGHGATSPFPILEQHVIAINRRWKDNASIRQWRLSMNKFTMSRHIIYYISNCRYCFNIGREHRSNGVYWIVDLDKLHCFQKCFDVDCNGISSNYFPLPNFVCTSLLSTKDLTLEADKITIQAANTDIENETVERDNMSKEVLLDLVREARAMNETEVQRRMLTSRRQNVILGMGVLQDSRNLFELTDDELLSAFALVKK
uniref:DNA-directed primase/polymerase protein n=1 Tax=Onchocerca volvulus TaxID=6282 RepID=A0A8R1TRN4_ONCVO